MKPISPFFPRNKIYDHLPGSIELIGSPPCDAGDPSDGLRGAVRPVPRRVPRAPASATRRGLPRSLLSNTEEAE